MRRHVPIIMAAALALGVARAESFKDLKGQPAPALTGSVWVGVPVSLNAVKGNAVLLAFWNADAPC
jgi:hypothetical protein